MSKKLFEIAGCFLTLAVMFTAVGSAFGQNKDDKKKPENNQGIGGKEHYSNILGVTIGMDVPTALQAVFVNAHRKPGQEKPDAKKNEGKDGKDIRVVYKDLPQGELQILFADGKYVKELVLNYSKPPLVDDLKLSYTGSLGNSTSLITTSTVVPLLPDAKRDEISTNTSVRDGTKEIDGFNATNLANTDRRRGEAMDGVRYDDRYSVAFADSLKLQRIWYRDEKDAQGFRVRVQFVSEKKTKAGADFVVRIAQKVVALFPDDEKEFRKAVNLSN